MTLTLTPAARGTRGPGRPQAPQHYLPPANSQSLRPTTVGDPARSLQYKLGHGDDPRVIPSIATWQVEPPSATWRSLDGGQQVRLVMERVDCHVAEGRAICHVANRASLDGGQKVRLVMERVDDAAHVGERLERVLERRVIRA